MPQGCGIGEGRHRDRTPMPRGGLEGKVWEGPRRGVGIGGWSVDQRQPVDGRQRIRRALHGAEQS